MTEVPIEVGYRSYIKLLRKKWDIVYHGKDLYFSHANKILEPFYDSNTREFYGIETNPTRLAIVKFLDQFRDGPGLYEPDAFVDLLKHSIVYSKRVKMRKPYRMSRHQESHPSLKQAALEVNYQHQDIIPRINKVTSGAVVFPYQDTYIVDEHPYEKMVGRVWTHIYVPSPADHSVLDDFNEGTGYTQVLREVCQDGHDVVIVEPITSRFYVKMVKKLYWWSNHFLRMMYTVSIFGCCYQPHRWGRNVGRFLVLSMSHLVVAGCMKIHALGRYKLPDRFHDTEALAELKYFREVLPVIRSKNVVLYKDEKRELNTPYKILKMLHLINLFVLCYNYAWGINYWYVN